MKCLVIADDEFVSQPLPSEQSDVLISCGDLPDHFILKAIEKSACRMAMAVKGNHDTATAFPLLLIDLHLKIVEYDGLRFGGFGGCQRYKLKGHHLYEQAEVEHALRSFLPVDVFVAHNSPWGIHDDTHHDEAHEGFRAFVEYIERCQPKLFLHGHQHLNRHTRLGATEIIGIYGHRLLTLPTNDAKEKTP